MTLQPRTVRSEEAIAKSVLAIWLVHSLDFSMTAEDGKQNDESDQKKRVDCGAEV